MSEPKWTPGPMCVDRVVSNHEHDIILSYPTPEQGSPVLVASVYDDEDDPKSVKRAFYTAQLFAVAHELYWQLVQAGELLEIAYLQNPDARFGAQTIAIEALLAKARGEVTP